MMKRFCLVVAFLASSSAFAFAEVANVENPFGASAAQYTAPVIAADESEKLEARKRSKRSRSARSSAGSSSGGSCDNLPRNCSAAATCADAQRALKCGMVKLDRDRDGVPCESICG